MSVFFRQLAVSCSVILLCSALSVVGFPNGLSIPSSTCGDMMPQHYSSAQSSPSPYTISVSTTTYTPGSTFNVTVKGSQFKGLLLLGRVTSDSSNVGTFASPSTNQFGLLCSNQGVVHVDNSGKSSGTFVWTAPSVSKGSIYFVATFVQSYSTLWTNVRTPSITDASSISTNTFTSTPSPTPTTSQSKTPISTPSTTLKSSTLISTLPLTSTSTSASISTPRSSPSSSSSPPLLTSSTSTNNDGEDNHEDNDEDNDDIGDGDLGHTMFKTSIPSSSIPPSTQSTTLPSNSASSILSAVPSTQSASTTPTSFLNTINTTTCDVSKSCFRSPSNCVSDCDYILTWIYNAKTQSVSFELESIATSENYWVAFALSTDTSMGSDSVVECVRIENANKYEVRASWNQGYSNVLLNNDQLGLVPGSSSAGYVNGRVVCRFQRFVSVVSSQGRRRRQAGVDTVFSLNTANYYALIAFGEASGGNKNMHDSKYASNVQINFTISSLSEGVGTSQDQVLKKTLIKAHGILMVFAWMVFASFGMLLPRYCKTAWPSTKWCGKMVWFQIHQPCMIMTLLLTTAGFIIIFVEAQDFLDLSLYSPVCKAHAPLGIIVMALVLINPIMATFRCEPNAKRRIIFNVFHFIVGLLAHMTAVVTIFLGLYMTKLGLPLWTKGVMGAFICFHALIEVILAVHMHSDKILKGIADSNTELVAFNVSTAKSTQQEATNSTFHNNVLTVHFVVAVSFAVAISIQIGLA